MATRVQVPIRIRTDARSLAERPGALDDAVRAAVARALGRSRAAVLEPRGANGYAHQPAIVWSGDALDAALRDASAARLSALIGTLVDEAGLRAAAAPAARPRAAERFEPARLERSTGRYAIPSYDGPGAPTALPLDPDPLTDVWSSLPEMEHTAQTLREMLRSVATRWGEPSPGATPGLIWLFEGKLYVWYLDGEKTQWFWLAPPTVWELEKGKVVAKRYGFPPPARTTAKVSAIFADPDDLGPIRAHVAETDRRDAQRLFSDPALVEDEITRRARVEQAAGTRVMIQLDIGGEVNEFRFTRLDFAFEGTLSLLPVTQTVLLSRLMAAATGVLGNGSKGSATVGAAGDGQDAGVDGTAGAPPLQYADPVPQFDLPITESDLCEPFLGEPDVAAFGADGAPLRDLIATIAGRLQIEPCCYAGRFCLIAARVIRRHAVGLSDAVAQDPAAGTTEHRKAGDGNLGELEFRPRSGVNVLLTRLASTVPLIEDLEHQLVDLMLRRGGALIADTYAGNSAGWVLHLLYEYPDALMDAVGRMFGETCRLLMLQLLDATALNIRARTDDAHMNKLARVFFATVVPQLSDVAELIVLKGRLDAMQADALRGPSDVEAHYHGRRHYSYGPEFAVKGDFPDAIRDAAGAAWTSAQLRDAITLQKGLASEIEPLVKHITDIPGSVAAMRPSEAATKAELGRIYDQMLDANADVRRRIAWDWEEAFKYAPIDPALPQETPEGLGFRLTGIHRLAHRALAPEFAGSRYYKLGVERLFVGERALEIIDSLATLGVLVVVSVLCPPLGAALNVAVAAYGVYDAHEKGEIRDALMNPEDVTNLAELDAEEFAQWLGLALTLIPEAGAAIKTAYKIGAAAAEEGIVVATRRVVTELAKKSAEESMKKLVEVGFAKLVVTEFVKVEVLNQILPHVLGPVVAAYQEHAIEAGPVANLDAATALITWYHTRGGH